MIPIDKAIAALDTACVTINTGGKVTRDTEVYKMMKQALTSLHAHKESLKAIVDEQAEDENLWFVPVRITEDVLQKALRRLHEAIEGKSSEECAHEYLSERGLLQKPTEER